jgi:hypothetical protein
MLKDYERTDRDHQGANYAAENCGVGIVAHCGVYSAGNMTPISRCTNARAVTPNSRFSR